MTATAVQGSGGAPAPPGPPAPANPLRSADGRRFIVRTMRRSDRALYDAGLAGLSAQSRYLRFAAPVTKLSERLLDQLMDLDGPRQVAYLALTPSEDAFVGVARYVRLEDDPAAAEVAIEIADDWQ